jgi:hypothetical protein
MTDDKLVQAARRVVENVAPLPWSSTWVTVTDALIADLRAALPGEEKPVKVFEVGAMSVVERLNALVECLLRQGHAADHDPCAICDLVKQLDLRWGDFERLQRDGILPPPIPVTREDEERDDDMSYPGGVSPDVPKIPCPPAAPEVSTHDVDCTCALCYLPLKADRVHPAVMREEVVEWYSNRMTTSDFLEAVRRSWLALDGNFNAITEELADTIEENRKLRAVARAAEEWTVSVGMHRTCHCHLCAGLITALRRWKGEE